MPPSQMPPSQTHPSQMVPPSHMLSKKPENLNNEIKRPLQMPAPDAPVSDAPLPDCPPPRLPPPQTAPLRCPPPRCPRSHMLEPAQGDLFGRTRKNSNKLWTSIFIERPSLSTVGEKHLQPRLRQYLGFKCQFAFLPRALIREGQASERLRECGKSVLLEARKGLARLAWCLSSGRRV